MEKPPIDKFCEITVFDKDYRIPVSVKRGTSDTEEAFSHINAGYYPRDLVEVIAQICVADQLFERGKQFVSTERNSVNLFSLIATLLMPISFLFLEKIGFGLTALGLVGLALTVLLNVALTWLIRETYWDFLARRARKKLNKLGLDLDGS